MFICMSLWTNLIHPPPIETLLFKIGQKAQVSTWLLASGLKLSPTNMNTTNTINTMQPKTTHHPNRKQMSPRKNGSGIFNLHICEAMNKSHTLNHQKKYFVANQRFLKGAEVCDLEMPSICRRKTVRASSQKLTSIYIVFTRNTIAIDTTHCVFSCFFFLSSHFKRCSCWASLSRACQRESQIGASKRCSLTGTHKLQTNFWKIRSMPIRKIRKSTNVHEY